jgi:hypothetical protein
MENGVNEMTETYQERVGRYRIERHEELPEAHKASYRLNGIDPDNCWSLIWSFNDEAAATKCLDDCNAHKASFQTYRLTDGGQAIVIERQAWF